MNNFTGHQDNWNSGDVTEFSSVFGPADGGSWSTSGNNEITLNSDAVSDSNTQRDAGNRLKFYIVNKSRFYDDDQTNIGGTATNYYHKFNFIGNAGVTNQPILEVTHDDPITPPSKTTLKGGTFTIKGGTFIIK